jgi:hypothetical protein
LFLCAKCKVTPPIRPVKIDATIGTANITIIADCTD